MLMLGTIFTITGGDIASTTAWAGSIVSDFMPLIVVILGIIIGVYIVRVIARLL